MVSYAVFGPPVGDVRNWFDRSAFLEQRIVSNRESPLIGQLAENNLSCLLSSSHCRNDKLGDWKIELRQTLTSELGLFSSLLGQNSFGVGSALEIILAVPERRLRQMKIRIRKLSHDAYLNRMMCLAGDLDDRFCFSTFPSAELITLVSAR